MRLTEFNNGQEGIITEILDEKETRNQFLLSGFFIGAQLTLNKKDRFHNMVHVTISDKIVALRMSDASKIELSAL